MPTSTGTTEDQALQAQNEAVTRHFIHVTSRNTFKRCRRKYRYREMMDLTPVGAKTIALEMGTALHKGVEEYYKCTWLRKKSMKHATAARRGWTAAMDYWNTSIPREDIDALYGDTSKLDQATTLLESMLMLYMDWIVANDDWDSVIGVEIPLDVKIEISGGREIELRGTLDMLAVKDGMYVAVDHKTAAQFKDPGLLTLDDQMTAYLWLIYKTYGELPESIRYRMIRKKIPAVPQPIKDGSRLSRQTKDTTYDIYLREIEAHGFDPEDYRDILDGLTNNEFIREEAVQPTKHRLAHFEEMLRAELEPIYDPNVIFYPSPQWDCSRWCDYCQLCALEMEQGDISGALEHNFVVKPYDRR